MTTIAPAPTPPPLSPGNRSALRILLVLAAAVLVVGCVATLGVMGWGINSVRMSADGKDLPLGMRSLVIDVSDATVHVKSDPQITTPRVELREVSSSRDVRQRLMVTTDADATRVVVAPDSDHIMDFGGMGEVTVTLPPTLAKTLAVTTQQGDGTLTVDSDLDRLVVRSSDGDVVLDGAVRVVDITAGDGSVASRKALSVNESFVAETGDGHIAVEFADPAPRRIEATTGDGDVEVSLPGTGPYLVRTRSGDTTSVRVPETNDPARAASEVTVRSEGGSITVDTRR